MVGNHSDFVFIENFRNAYFFHFPHSNRAGNIIAEYNIRFGGNLNPWISGKDVILYIIGQIGVDGALYQSLEFVGDGVQYLSMDSRLTIRRNLFAFQDFSSGLHVLHAAVGAGTDYHLVNGHIAKSADFFRVGRSVGWAIRKAKFICAILSLQPHLPLQGKFLHLRR